MITDRAAFPVRIKNGCVAVLGKHQSLLVSEHAGGSFDELAQTVRPVTRIGEQTSKTRGFSGYSVESRQRGRLAPPMRASGLRDTLALGGSAGRIALTGRLPGESKKGLASGGISCSEIGDLGEQDTDRIPKLDVTRSWPACE